MFVKDLDAAIAQAKKDAKKYRCQAVVVPCLQSHFVYVYEFTTNHAWPEVVKRAVFTASS